VGFDPSTKHKTTTTSLGPGQVGKYALLRDEKASGVGGGTFTSGAWRTRVLNTTVADEIGITLSSNQFTLPEGTYRIVAQSSARSVNGNMARIQNITDAATELEGPNMVTFNTETSMFAPVQGQFTITSSKTFELQHWGSSTQADGFGVALSLGTSEIYAEVEILKVA